MSQYVRRYCPTDGCGRQLEKVQTMRGVFFRCPTLTPGHAYIFVPAGTKYIVYQVGPANNKVPLDEGIA